MGSPLAPTLANFFLAHMECKLLKKNNVLIQPIFYRRYVDDIFAVFRDNSCVTFLELLIQLICAIYYIFHVARTCLINNERKRKAFLNLGISPLTMRERNVAEQFIVKLV